MQTLLRTLVVGAWLAACSGKTTVGPTTSELTAASDTDTDADADSDADTDTDTDPALPDPFEGLDERCATTYAPMNFTVYYVGQLSHDGMVATGTETMVFYPSSPLIDACDLGPSCVAVWDLAGEVVASQQPAANYALALMATRNVAMTTCDGVYAPSWEPDQYEVLYALTENTDGTLAVAFDGSGSPLADGNWAESGTGSVLNYASDNSCSSLIDPPPCP